MGWEYSDASDDNENTLSSDDDNNQVAHVL